jgi:hypothetical protein
MLDMKEIKYVHIHAYYAFNDFGEILNSINDTDQLKKTSKNGFKIKFGISQTSKIFHKNTNDFS